MVGDGILGPDALELRERERYNEYLIEETSKHLPNAFDLGWKKNFLHVFGAKPLLWFVPVKNSIGDGWAWETSEAWKEAQRELQDRRRREMEAERERMRRAGWGDDVGEPVVANGAPPNGGYNPYNGWTRQSVTGVPSPGEKGRSKAARILGAREEEFSHGLGGSRYSPKVTMANKEIAARAQDSKKKKVVMSRDEISEDDTDAYDNSSDEQDEEADGKRKNGESSKSAAARSNSTPDALNRKAVDTWSEGW
ncbi:hypothetical protein ABW19_dt0204267 [Dactylella cylindrospora]|nr:hypothetical protein ABW19_dt0204267 [Dactylella cylindrospora]